MPHGVKRQVPSVARLMALSAFLALTHAPALLAAGMDGGNTLEPGGTSGSGNPPPTTNTTLPYGGQNTATYNYGKNQTPSMLPPSSYTLNSSRASTGIQPAGVQPAGAVSPDMPWTNTNLYQDCGQDCLYGRANETLSLEALTIVNTATRLQQEYIDGQSDTGPPTHFLNILNEISDYCPTVTQGRHNLSTADYKKNSDAQTAASDCLQVYMIFQIPVLQKIHGAIAHNQDAQSALQGHQKVVANTDPTYATKLPQTPYMPTTADIEFEARKLKTMTPQDYATWVTNAEKSWTPDCNDDASDYPLTHTIPRDPSNPSGDQLVIINRDANGHVQTNTAACQAATQAAAARLQVFNKKLADNTSFSDMVKPSQALINGKTIAASQKNARNQTVGLGMAPLSSAQWLQNATYGQGPPPPATGSKGIGANGTNNEVEDYRSARFTMVQLADSSLDPTGHMASIQTHNFGGANGPAPASAVAGGAGGMTPDQEPQPVTPPPGSRNKEIQVTYSVDSNDALGQEIANLNCTFGLLSNSKVDLTADTMAAKCPQQ